MNKSFVDARLVAEIADCKIKMAKLNKLADEYEQKKDWNYVDSAKAFQKVLEIIGRSEKAGMML